IGADPGVCSPGPTRRRSEGRQGDGKGTGPVVLHVGGEVRHVVEGEPVGLAVLGVVVEDGRVAVAHLVPVEIGRVVGGLFGVGEQGRPVERRTHGGSDRAGDAVVGGGQGAVAEQHVGGGGPGDGGDPAVEEQLLTLDPAGEGTCVRGDDKIGVGVVGPHPVDVGVEVGSVEASGADAVSGGDHSQVVEDQVGEIGVGGQRLENGVASFGAEEPCGVVVEAGQLDPDGDAELVHHGGVAEHAVLVVGELHRVVQYVEAGFALHPAGG